MGSNVARAAWFRATLACADGGAFASQDICREPLLRDAEMAAASDAEGVLAERIVLDHGDALHGHYADPAGRTVAFARTPGYESYRGMGWYGVVWADAAPTPAPPAP